MLKHLNKPVCDKCEEVLHRYLGAHPIIEAFYRLVRAKDKEAHISSVGRGYEDQEHYFKMGTSKAHYGQSAHNYNAAVDFFRLTQAGGAEFRQSWYKALLGPLVATQPSLKWYGVKGSPFLEFPHVELADWRLQVKQGLLHLVEKAPQAPTEES